MAVLPVERSHHPFAPLVDDRVHGDGRLAGRAVADDELALAAADGDHRVDRLDAGLQGLFHGLPLDDARRDNVHLARLGRVDRPEAVDRPAERVHHPPHQSSPHGHIQHATGAAHFVPLAQHEVVAEDDGPDVVFLQVQRLADDLVSGVRRGELQHLPRHRRREAVDPGDAVLDLQHRADLADVDLRQVGGLDLLEEDFLKLAGSEDGIGGHSTALERL